MKEQSISKRRAGLTLMELLTVVIILSIVASMVIPRVSNSGVAAKRKLCTHRIHEVNKALERYFVSEGKFAKSVTELPDFPEREQLSCPLNDREFVVDSSTGRVLGCDCAQ